MRSVFPKMALLLLTVGLSAHADTTYHLYTFGSNTETSGSVVPGGTIDLWVRMETDDPVCFVAYDVLLEADDWQLTQRSYAVYGWHEGDFWDGSIPLETATYPITVDDSLYDATLTDPDFHLDTSRADDTEVVPPGTWTVEDFTLQIPPTTPIGSYTISLQNPGAWNWAGGSFDAFCGDDFTLGVVPEPTTLALFGLGLGARLRRRKQAAS